MNDDEKKIHDIITSARFASFATTGDDAILARPMTPVRIEEDWSFLFITVRGELTTQADGRPVNLAFMDGTDFVSVSGTGELRDDQALKEELWSPAIDAFCTGGPENPENVVLVVHGESARYWDSPGGPIVLASMLKAKLTGTQPQTGDSGTVQLG